MSKLTPVFKHCNEMTLISSWPESFSYTPGMSEALLLTRIFDISACQYAQQFAQPYKDMTDYDLPFITLTDDEYVAIHNGCSHFIAETETLKKVAQRGVDEAEKYLKDIRTGVIQPNQAYPLKAMLDDANTRIVNEGKRRDAICEKLDSKIVIFKSVMSAGRGDDISHLINIRLHGFDRNISTRVNRYKSMFDALRCIITLANEKKFRVEPGSVVMRQNNMEAEFINEKINQATIDYYKSINEGLRNSLSLADYTELRLLKFKEDAR
ncbi:hypothetical protein F4785_25895, partial [Salmonella enterica]|nr:hypothetical protein [Salmonella enterica]